MNEVIMQLAIVFGFLGIIGATINYTYPILNKVIEVIACAVAEVFLFPFMLLILTAIKIAEHFEERK